VLAFAIACLQGEGGSTAVFSGGRARGEPVYTLGVSTLIWQDNMDSYVSAIDMWTNAQSRRFVGFTPTPFYPYDPATQLISPGRGGAGKAIRVVYAGIYQESHSMWLWHPTHSDPTKPLYISHWFRLTATTVPNVKWIEIWHPGGIRIQFNTFWSRRGLLNLEQWGFPPGGGRIWQVFDGNTTTDANGQQPYPPTADQSADGRWHRVTYAYKPHASVSNKDGFARMWIDGKKIIDIEQVTVGVMPPGAPYQWCDQADVDVLQIGSVGLVDGISFAGPQTTTSGPWTLDWDDFLMWQ
jgi:hypothetical protein